MCTFPFARTHTHTESHTHTATAPHQMVTTTPLSDRGLRGPWKMRASPKSPAAAQPGGVQLPVKDCTALAGDSVPSGRPSQGGDPAASQTAQLWPSKGLSALRPAGWLAAGGQLQESTKLPGKGKDYGQFRLQLPSCSQPAKQKPKESTKLPRKSRPARTERTHPLPAGASSCPNPCDFVCTGVWLKAAKRCGRFIEHTDALAGFL